MRTYNVFNSEESANEAQYYDYQTWIAVHSYQPYIDQTTCWDEVKYHVDNQVWYYSPCPTSDATYNTLSWDNQETDL